MMNRIQDIIIIKASGPTAGRISPDLKANRMEMPEFPGRPVNSSLYIEDIHYRAETVTPILKGIPGYWHGHVKN
jgi:hypothetical protein